MIYSYFELIFGIIIILLSIIGFICCFKNDDVDSTWIIVVFFALFVGTCMLRNAFYPSTPTEEDVLDKKAEYIETIHITGNDTVRTYEIKWLEEFNK